MSRVFIAVSLLAIITGEIHAAIRGTQPGKCVKSRVCNRLENVQSSMVRRIILSIESVSESHCQDKNDNYVFCFYYGNSGESQRQRLAVSTPRYARHPEPTTGESDIMETKIFRGHKENHAKTGRKQRKVEEKN